MIKSRLAISLAAAGAFLAVAGAPALAQQKDIAEAELASQTLASGDQARAIAALEAQRENTPEDPGVLINLGIAYAHLGDERKAHELFTAALISPEPIELETADGSLTNSRRLARKAMRMLGRGEFRDAGQSDRLTLRD